MSTTVAQLVAQISVAGSEAARGQLLAMDSTVSSVGSRIGGILGGAAIAGGVALAGIGIASVKMAGDFQKNMTTLVTGAGESQANLKMVSAGILKMAVDTGTSTQQLSDGMYMIESAGFHGAQGLDVLKAAAEGAKVGNADLGVVADGVTTIMNDYAGAHVTATNATNDLIATVAQGKTHMQDLASSMAMVLPTSSAVGVSLTDVSAAMATMTARGVPAADASTYLRQMLIALTAPASGAKTALRDIGLTSDQVAASMKQSLPDTLQLIQDHLKDTYTVGSPQYIEALKSIAGGSKQMQGMLDLTGDSLNTFKQNVISIGDAVKQGGNDITGWNLVQQDFNQKMSVAKEQVETLAIKFGTVLLPAAGQVVDWFSNKVVPAISNASDKAGDFAHKALPLIQPAADSATQGLTKKNGILDTLGALGKDLGPDMEAAGKAFAWTMTNIIPPAITGAEDAINGLLAAIDGLVVAINSIFNGQLQASVQKMQSLPYNQQAPGNAASQNAKKELQGFAKSMAPTNKHATGTLNAPGGQSLVAEGGEPEVVMGPTAGYLPQGSKVIPFSKLGGQQTIHITMPAPCVYIDGRALAQSLMPHIVDQVRLNVGLHGRY